MFKRWRNLKVLGMILCMLIKIQHRCNWWILNNGLIRHRCWCKWLWIIKNWSWRWLRNGLWWCYLLLSTSWISLINKWLRRDGLVLLWHRLLGCGGLTPSQRRRLDSWPGHLTKELLNAQHWLLLAWALHALHDYNLAFMQALQHGK